MRKIAYVFMTTLGAGWLLAGSATGAAAHQHSRCDSCNAPIAPTTIYKTVHPQRYETKYHDVNVTHTMHKVHRITTVTRVQPIIHIHEVTRVHHHTHVVVTAAYHRATQNLSPIYTTTHSTVNLYECGCRP